MEQLKEIFDEYIYNEILKHLRISNCGDRPLITPEMLILGMSGIVHSFYQRYKIVFGPYSSVEIDFCNEYTMTYSNRINMLLITIIFDCIPYKIKNVIEEMKVIEQAIKCNPKMKPLTKISDINDEIGNTEPKKQCKENSNKIEQKYMRQQYRKRMY